MLKARLLGPPEVDVEGKPIDVDTKKAIALLAYLAVEGSASRDVLATMFWFESSAERARASLRRTLSSLRSGIGAGSLDTDRDQITLLGVDIDLTSFNSAILETANHGHDPLDVCARCLPHLEQAVAIYRGDFLEGFAVRDAPDFEDWSRNLAEGYRLKVGEVYNRLAMARAAAGDYGAAMSAVARWIDLDELHEPAHRLLILLNAWAGDRPGAIEAYRRFVAVLDRELGVPPLEETTELYEAVLDEDLPPAPGMRRQVRAEAGSSASSELLDRRDHVDHLHSLLYRSRSEGVIATLEGSAWMGKTRLLEELAASANSHLVLMGRSYLAEQGLPYGVLAQLLDAARPAVVELGEQIPEWVLTEASRIDPTYARGNRSSEDPLGELRLMEAIHLMLVELANRKPLLVTIDDVQWTDTASSAVLSYLGRRIADEPILLLMARRTDSKLNEQIGALLGRAERISLSPLTALDIAELTDDADEVVARSGGVPLLVSDAMSGNEGTGGVQRYIELRLETVSDLGRQVLTTAAVLSGSCDVSLLRATSGRSENEIVEAIDELVTAGLLREVPNSDSLTFTLDALEEVAYESLTLARRRLLHRRAGEALTQPPRSSSDPRVAAAAAGQFERAGDDRAADWYVTAAQLARSIYANGEAAVFYQSALALGAGNAGDIHLALGELAMTSGDYETAMRELNTAAARSTGPTLGLVEHRLGEVHRLIGRFGVAEDHYNRAVADHPTPAELYSDWSLLEHRLGNVERSRELAEKALEVAATLDGPTLARVHNVFGVVSTDPSEAMEHLDRALGLSGEDELTLMAALNNKAHLLSEIGNQDAALRLVDRAIEIAARTGHRHREAALRNLAADLHHRSGRRELSEQAQTEAMRLFADVGTEDLEPEVWLLSRW